MFFPNQHFEDIIISLTKFLYTFSVMEGGCFFEKLLIVYKFLYYSLIFFFDRNTTRVL